MEYTKHATEVLIDYTNWKGERSIRRIVPLSIEFTQNEWHPETQWLLRAWDWDKQDIRSFALKNIHNWREDNERSED